MLPKYLKEFTTSILSPLENILTSAWSSFETLMTVSLFLFIFRLHIFFNSSFYIASAPCRYCSFSAINAMPSANLILPNFFPFILMPFLFLANTYFKHSSIYRLNNILCVKARILVPCLSIFSFISCRKPCHPRWEDSNQCFLKRWRTCLRSTAER